MSKTHHSLKRILNVVGNVKQLTVLQLFTESLQQRHRLIESDRHGDSGQVLANVVVQDGHDANVAVVCSWGGDGSATAWIIERQIGKIKNKKGGGIWEGYSQSRFLL